MEGGPPIFRQDCTCPALLEDTDAGFPYGAVTRYGSPFQTLPVPKTHATGLIRVRSPLLAESRLMSVPPATEMFQFAGFASPSYEFRRRYPLRGGLPHSEIPGSPIARISPGLFAACHVLHRLSVPRHPPDALLLRLIPGVLLGRRRNAAAHRGKTPSGSGLNMKTLLRTHPAPPCFRRDKLCARHVRLGHMTNSLFTLQSTPPPGWPGRCL